LRRRRQRQGKDLAGAGDGAAGRGITDKGEEWNLGFRVLWGLMKKFLAKGLSGRKIELDERLLNLSKIAQHEKMFCKRQLHPWLPYLQYVVVPDIKVSI
jgi:hypothetical protein